MNRIILFILSLLLVPLQAFGVPAPSISRPAHLDLTILHDNDLHGHILPFPYTERGRSLVESPSRGGAARRSTLIRQLRRTIANPVLVVDSGDIATRGPLATTYEGIPDVEAMNVIGYDVVAVGNNEFKLKDGIAAADAAGAQAAFLRLVKRSRFPWIAANATDQTGSLLQGVEPFVVREVGGIRVGFLGLTTTKSATYPQVKGWTISDPVTAAGEWIPRAREQCDVLIALTHIGTVQDVVLAAHTRGIDAIIGGDSHTYLYKAVEVKNLDGTRVPIVQDGEFGADLGRLDLHFRRDAAGRYHLASYQYRLLPVGPSIAEDPSVNRVLAPYLGPMMAVVGTVTQVGRNADDRTRRTTQLVTRAVRSEARADIALDPLGGDFFESFRQPKVTRYDVFAVMPFEDDIATAELTGLQLKKLLAADPTTVAAGMPAHLDDGHTYRAAFIGYEAESNYHIPSTNLVDTHIDVRDGVIDYLQHGGH